MKPRWHVEIDAARAGRCYLSWNTCLRDLLESTGRLARAGQQPDVWYAQAGLHYAPPPKGALIALQSVTAPSLQHAQQAARAWERDVEPDVVLAYSEVGKTSLVEIGLPRGKIRVVRPGISMV